MGNKERITKFESWLRNKLTEYEITCLDDWISDLKREAYEEGYEKAQEEMDV